MKEDKIYSLIELVEFYDVILPDTCVISNCLKSDNGKNRDSIEDKASKSKEQYKSYSFWKKFISENSKNNILFCEGVFNEFEYIKKVKFTHKFKGHKIDPNFKTLSRNIGYASNRKNNLVKILKKNNLLLSLSDEEQTMFEKNFENFKYLVNERNYDIGPVDFSLLLTSIVLSKSRGKTALLSNDFSLLRSWVSALSMQKDLRKCLDFYTREYFDGFMKRLYFLE